MANVSVTIAPDPEIRIWQVPGDPQIKGQPIGEVVFRDADHTVIAKGANDEQKVTIQMTLPRDYVYQMQEALLFSHIETEAQALDLGPGWIGRCADQRHRYPFLMLNRPIVQGSTTGNYDLAFIANFTSITLNETAAFLPTNIPSSIVGPSGTFGNNADQPGCLLFSTDITTDATAAYALTFYFRFLMFTIAQDNAWPIHAAANVKGAVI